MAKTLQTYERMAAAISHIHAQHQDGAAGTVSLAALAAQAGLSPHHFQRLFTRWAGISPKRYLDHVRGEAAKARLRQGSDLLNTSLDAGYSGPGRLHDRFVTIEATSPAQYARDGEGLVIRHGWHPSPFGSMLLALTDRGICWLSFGGESAAAREHQLAELRREWPRAHHLPDARGTAEVAGGLFGAAAPVAPLSVLVRGTNFQLQVWRALLRIPEGQTVSYGALATDLGRPRAARALGSAVGANPVSYLIPCHRV
ncbi:MAG: methylated-DNA--[protein]-cysteine S-methyltransferase, partial [Pseudomonadota bacterium]|nr:methylated-DNA--[protein]-cysteine S-methyltransferase [Pseudomonadota bacterium]